MINRFVAIIASLVLLSGCSGLIPPLDSGDAIPTDQAVIVGKISLSPMVDEDGYITDDITDDLQTVFITYHSDKKVNLEKEDTGYIEFDEVETNKFFALPIDIYPDLKATELKFVIRRKKWYSNTEYIYISNIKRLKFSIASEIKHAEVYYMGEIKIDLDQTSFKLTDKGVYDDEEIQYISPKSMMLVTDASAAKDWFKKEFPKSDKSINKIDISVAPSGIENVFNETQITTTYNRY